MATDLRRTATVHPAPIPPLPVAEPQSSARRCLKPFLFVSSFTIVFVIFTTMMMIWFPVLPMISIHEVEFSTKISPATWNLSLEVTNPNFLSKIFFDHFDVLLSYDSMTIAHAELGPFVQARMGRTVLYAHSYVSKHVVMKMVEDRKGGCLVVQIQGLYAIKFKKGQEWILGFWHDHFYMCKNLFVR